jgi:hypothetical protein
MYSKKNTPPHIAVQGRMIAHRDTTLVQGMLAHALSVSTQDDRSVLLYCGIVTYADVIC